MTTVEENKQLIKEVLEAYPEKAAKRREKHLDVYEEGNSDCGVKSNKKSVPGVMTTRGCAYAGAKGVVWGPVKDMIHISHGPVGCGYYSWSGRRNYYIGTTGVDTFGTMQFTSDFQERDIVFGGDKKLAKLIDELEILFPLSKGTTIESECPIGLIGDDIEAVARKKAKDTGKPVVPVRCEGFRGVSQSLGHHIANDTVRDWVLPKADEYRQLPEGFEPGAYDVNIIGDYNIGGDAWPSRRLLEAIGLRVISQFSGDGTFNEVVMTPLAKMNLIHCYRSMNYTILSDNADAFDSPNTGEFKMYNGLTTLEEAGDSINSEGTFFFQKYTTPKTQDYITKEWGQSTYNFRPFGIKGTDEFLTKLSELTGKPVPQELVEERGRAVDAINDSQAWIHGKRIALYGDPDHVFSLVQFLLEL
jgi:nitrogenase molybdenum-iron protein alpha/beta subunit